MESWRRKKEEKEKAEARKCFLKNGSVFLQKLIADCNGISNPIRTFSSDQISKATDHFDPKCSLPKLSSENSFWSFACYKGVIEGRSYVIKRFTEYVVHREENAYNDIVISARRSNHIGFLKLFGSCLEFPQPVLVFEDLEYRALDKRGSLGSVVLPWNVRLKIAKEVAVAITYIHTAFPRIIIHRNITPTNVLLDKNGTAKLTNLSAALRLPEGKSWIKDTLTGTVGYIDPIYQSTSIVTEYSDVYSFGIFMLVLLIGMEPMIDGPDHYHIHSYVKYLRKRGEPVELWGDSDHMRPGQMKKFLNLALRCCEKRNKDRPTMITVAKETKQIEQVSL